MAARCRLLMDLSLASTAIYDLTSSEASRSDSDIELIHQRPNIDISGCRPKYIRLVTNSLRYAIEADERGAHKTSRLVPC